MKTRTILLPSEKKKKTTNHTNMKLRLLLIPYHLAPNQDFDIDKLCLV